MQPARVWFLLALLPLLAGCVYSLNPLYTDDVLVFEPALVGEWYGVDRFHGSETYTRSPARYILESTTQDGRYKLIYVDRKDVRRTFGANLIRLQEHLFLDVQRSDQEFYNNDLLLPVHAFFSIEMSPSVLIVRPLDYGKTARFLEAKPDAIRHTQTKRFVLLTADTMHLRTFLAAHGEQLFDDRPYAVLSKEVASKVSGELLWAGVGTTVEPIRCQPPMPSNKACPPEGQPWTYEITDRVPVSALLRHQFLMVAFVLIGPPAGTPMDLSSLWSFRSAGPSAALPSWRGGYAIDVECTVGETCYAMEGPTTHRSAGVMHVELSWRGQSLLQKDFDLYEAE